MPTRTFASRQLARGRGRPPYESQARRASLRARLRTMKDDAMRLLLTWLINAAALMALPYLMHSVTVTSVGTALIAALVLGLVNTLIRPVLVLLTLPVTLVSLGLFILVINAFLFWLVAQVVEGFHVAGFGSAFLAAILYSIISWALSTLILKNDGNP